MVVSLQRYYVSGAALMVDTSVPSIEWVQRCFPITTNGLLDDRDVFVHSIGCSIWNTFGHEKGYMAIVECPAPNTHAADIRSDSGWFKIHQDHPNCLIEFERYQGVQDQQKIECKLKNLMEACSRWEFSADVLILSIWSKGIVASPDLTALKNIFYRGFTNSKGLRIQLPSTITVILNRFYFVDNGTSISLHDIKSELLK